MLLKSWLFPLHFEETVHIVPSEKELHSPKAILFTEAKQKCTQRTLTNDLSKLGPPIQVSIYFTFLLCAWQLKEDNFILLNISIND